jgi:hypothetical protein
MSKSKEQLNKESSLASELLQNKIIARILRPKETEVVIECTDGTRFFVHESENVVELSIT